MEKTFLEQFAVKVAAVTVCALPNPLVTFQQDLRPFSGFFKDCSTLLCEVTEG